jgi:hypothetical protein
LAFRLGRRAVGVVVVSACLQVADAVLNVAQPQCLWRPARRSSSSAMRSASVPLLSSNGSCIKVVWLWAFGFVSYFYTAFVLQMLWNWFAVTALRLDPIGYWQMYGFHMLILVLLEKSTFQSEDRWKRTVTMLVQGVSAEGCGAPMI